MSDQIPKIIAHRGARGSAPENTLAAMRKAKEEGATWVEFDVMLSADGQAVVIHDDNVKRTTNGEGEVGLLDYQQLAQLDAGSWFAPKFAGEKIPRLIDVMACLDELQLGANIEIKPYPGKERETALVTLQLVQQYWSSTLPPPLLSSFSLDSMRVVREHDAHIALGLLLQKWRDDWQAIADDLACKTVHLNQRIITARRVEQIKATGRAVLCYTVNRTARARRLLAWGVDAVFTDYPQRLLTKL